MDDNCDVHFSHGGCIVQDQVSGMVIAKGPKVGRLFPLYFSIPNVISFACMATANNNEVWHKKLGHSNFGVLTHLLKHGFLGNNNNPFSSFDCATCRLGKSKTLPFPVHGSRASASFEIVHTDVWGASPITSHGHYRYFLTFIDDYSRFTWIYFLRSKADVFSVLQRFVALVETQFSTSIKILRSDSGGEYMSHAFQNYLQQKGIISQRSCPYTPQQNGVAERKNRHLLDVVRTLLIESSVPTKFWVEALSTAVYLINRLPTVTLNYDSPYLCLFGIPPEYKSLHTFGCVCFVHLPPTERHKLVAQSVTCAFMGYSPTQKGFICYDAHANKFRISRNVIFFENQYFFQSHVIPDSPTAPTAPFPPFDHVPLSAKRFKPGIVYQRRPPPVPLPDTTSSLDSTLPAPRRSTRVIHPPDRYGFSHTSFTATLDTISVPHSYTQAATQACWQQAMQEEIQALQENHT